MYLQKNPADLLVPHGYVIITLKLLYILMWGLLESTRKALRTDCAPQAETSLCLA